MRSRVTIIPCAKVLGKIWVGKANVLNVLMATLAAS